MCIYYIYHLECDDGYANRVDDEDDDEEENESEE